jgi:uncharacterized damage-inducible protein DinB
MLNLVECIAVLNQQAQAIQQLASGISDEQARWKPNADSWSILEVINHLYDEEREDFRTRLKHILDQTEGLPPGIDTIGWVTARQYNQRDLQDSIAQFLQEREASLEWLRSLAKPNWDAKNELPSRPLRAGDMLMSWLAHDLLHLRQIVELRYAYLKQQAEPYQIDYAGEW